MFVLKWKALRLRQTVNKDSPVNEKSMRVRRGEDKKKRKEKD